MFCIYTKNPPKFGKLELVKTCSTEKEAVRFLEERFGTDLFDTEIRHKGVVISAKKFAANYLQKLLRKEESICL